MRIRDCPRYADTNKKRNLFFGIFRSQGRAARGLCLCAAWNFRETHNGETPLNENEN